MIRFEHVTFTYALSNKTALRDVNLEIPEGELVVVSGRSGSGKSTFLRCIDGLVPHFYGGRLQGRIVVDGIDTLTSPVRDAARVVGMVFQDPENQFITSSAGAEISFGLENLGLDERRAEERIQWVIDRLGLRELLDRSPHELSGGEKQKIIIASVLAIGTRVLALDEPTSQLDPFSSSEILDLLSWMKDQGYTVVVSEHRLQKLLKAASRVIALEDGKVVFDGEPDLFSKRFPSLVRLEKSKPGAPRPRDDKERLLLAHNLYFRYPGTSRWILQGLKLDLMGAEVLGVIGRNGSGKSTLAGLLAGILKPQLGSIILDGRDISSLSTSEVSRKVGIVFQDPNAHLFHDTVEEEIWFAPRKFGQAGDGWVGRLVKTMGLEDYMSSNPRDLSGGERERVAIASVASYQPEILILDEPTRGLDLEEKRKIMLSMQRMARDAGLSLLLLSHDLEVVEAFSDRVAVLSGGRISFCCDPKEAVRRFENR